MFQLLGVPQWNSNGMSGWDQIKNVAQLPLPNHRAETSFPRLHLKIWVSWRMRRNVRIILWLWLPNNFNIFNSYIHKGVVHVSCRALVLCLVNCACFVTCKIILFAVFAYTGAHFVRKVVSQCISCAEFNPEMCVFRSPKL